MSHLQKYVHHTNRILIIRKKIFAWCKNLLICSDTQLQEEFCHEIFDCELLELITKNHESLNIANAFTFLC